MARQGDVLWYAECSSLTLHYCFYSVLFHFLAHQGKCDNENTLFVYGPVVGISSQLASEREWMLLTLISISSGNNGQSTHFTSSGHYGFRIAECILSFCVFFLLLSSFRLIFFFVCLNISRSLWYALQMYIVHLTLNVLLSIMSSRHHSVNFRLRPRPTNSLKITIHFDLVVFVFWICFYFGWHADFKLHWPIPS